MWPRVASSSGVVVVVVAVAVAVATGPAAVADAAAVAAVAGTARSVARLGPSRDDLRIRITAVPGVGKRVSGDCTATGGVPTWRRAFPSPLAGPYRPP